MVETLKISVVIPAFNSAQWIAKAVESVLAQTASAQEIIVVNDGSTDATTDVLSKYGDSIKVITTPNRGAGAARNVGIDASTGDWIAFLDADDFWAPDKLARTTATILRRPDGDLFFHDMIVVDDADRVVDVYRFKDFGNDAAKKLVMGNGIATSGATARAAKTRGILRFREALRKKAGCEDWDFWIRLAMIGNVSHIPEALGIYRRLDSSATRSGLDDLLDDCLTVVNDAATSLFLTEAATAAAVAATHRSSAIRRLAAFDRVGARRDVENAIKLTDATPNDMAVIAASLLPDSAMKFFLALKRKARMKFAHKYLANKGRAK